MVHELDELLGTVAHELRSPLATVLTGVYTIDSTCELDPVARWALAGMQRQLHQAMRLVDDLFDVCAGGLGKLSLRKEVVDLAEVVAGAAETAGHLLSARWHRLTVSLPPEPIYLEADPPRPRAVVDRNASAMGRFFARWVSRLPRIHFDRLATRPKTAASPDHSGGFEPEFGGARSGDSWHAGCVRALPNGALGRRESALRSLLHPCYFPGSGRRHPGVT